MRQLEKTVDVNHSFVTSGDGLWGLEGGLDGRYDKLRLRVLLDEDYPNGICELQAFHNFHVNDINDGTRVLLNPVFDGGIPYTDTASEEAAEEAAQAVPEFAALNIRDVSGSEQGMQGEHYLSCDCEITLTGGAQQLLDLGFIES